MDVFDARLFALAIVAALGYGVATIGMKIASGNWTVLAFGLILLGFIAATQAEVVLMRGVTLGTLYLVIIAVETLIVLTYAYCIGEGLSTRDAAGGVFVLIGLAVISH
ncbi:MAG: 5-aminolevulinate synthase [Pseudomonadota bacterium]